MKAIKMLLVLSSIMSMWLYGCGSDQIMNSEMENKFPHDSLILKIDSLVLSYPQNQIYYEHEIDSKDTSIMGFHFTCSGTTTNGGVVTFFAILTDPDTEYQYISIDTLKNNNINNPSINISLKLLYYPLHKYAIFWGFQEDLVFLNSYIKLSNIRVYAIKR